MATALSSMSVDKQSTPLDPFSSSTQHALTNPSVSEAKGRREMSRQQWQTVKALIQRIYIDENRPFPYLAQILRAEYGFEPTKRQFSRKINEWGFRKNVSQSERRSILLGIQNEPGQASSSVRDRRVRPGKLENWRRRYKHESIGGACATQPSGVCTTSNGLFEPQIVSTQEKLPFSIAQTLSEEISELASHKECQSAYEVSGLDSGPRSSQDTMEGVEIAVHGSVPSNHCTWPFNWATVDVPGSPGLSRLFSALEIECSQPVPPISLDEPDAEDSQHISGAEMIDLWNEQNRTIAYELHALHPLRQASLTYELSKKPSVAFPWRNPALAYCGWAPSPLDEIYVFPTPPSQPSHKLLDPVAPSFLRLDIEAADLRTKLSKLNQLLPDGHPSIIITKIELADIYLDQGQYNKAGKLFRCAAIAAQKTWGSTNVATFSAWLDVVNCLTFQGLDLQAHALITKLRPTILQYVDPEHGIATRATQLLAVVCDNLGNSEAAEDLLRQVLQIYLNRLGSKSCQTWMSMKSFGWILSRLRRYSEAEKLARIALQLQSEIMGVSETDICEAVDCLSMLYNAQYKYEDSADLCRSQLERLQASLGPEHPSIIRIRGSFAISLARQGHYTESEAIFQSLLTQESESMEWHRDTLNNADEWSGVLLDMGRVVEATSVLEKVYQGRLRLLGPELLDTMGACYILGDCYERQGRYKDAFNLYNEQVEKIRSAKGDDHPSIARVQGWAEWLKDDLERRGKDGEGTDYSVESMEGDTGDDGDVV